MGDEDDIGHYRSFDHYLILFFSFIHSSSITFLSSHVSCFLALFLSSESLPLIN